MMLTVSGSSRPLTVIIPKTSMKAAVCSFRSAGKLLSSMAAPQKPKDQGSVFTLLLLLKQRSSKF